MQPPYKPSGPSVDGWSVILLVIISYRNNCFLLEISILLIATYFSFNVKLHYGIMFSLQ